MTMQYSVFWTVFKVVPRGEGETVKTVREIRTRLSEAQKDSLLQDLTANGVMASVSRYDDSKL